MYSILYRQISIKSSEGIDGSQTSLAEQKYLFVEQPSEDFLCPVTSGLLLKPHLTACCGNHISQEAAMRIQGETTIWIQGEGGACPLCNTPDLVTLLDKYYLRQVKKLRVFCHHKERGCKWHGELFDLDHHLQSCPYSDLSRYTLRINLLTCTSSYYPYHIVKKRLLGLNKTGQSIQYMTLRR